MGAVIKCPNTGQEVPPRFQTAEALCDAAILIDNPFTCPACGQLHEWEINDLPTGGPQDLARPPLSPST